MPTYENVNPTRTSIDHSMQVRTASGINALLGLWMIASPWIYGYAASDVSVWSNVIAGALIAVLGALRYRSPHQIMTLSWINLALGAWTAISPWVFGYVGSGGRFWNSLLVGVAVLLLAIWSGSATATERPHAHA